MRCIRDANYCDCKCYAAIALQENANRERDAKNKAMHKSKYTLLYVRSFVVYVLYVCIIIIKKN